MKSALTARSARPEPIISQRGAPFGFFDLRGMLELPPVEEPAE
jgi:hypothetical protein